MKTSIKKKENAFFLAERFCRFTIIIILLVAALPKLFNIADFVEIINAYGMLPQVALQPVAVLLPIVEIVLAAGLFFNSKMSTYLTICLLLFFIAILGYAISQGLDIDCGCFGQEDPEHRAFQGLRIAIVRDIVMILFLTYSIWYGKYQQS